jgi:hypothetical protein
MTGLQLRDDRLESEIRAVIDGRLYRAMELEQQAAALRAQAAKIKTAVAEERWWDLEGILSPEDIESLCNVSPKSLL